jgi:predicted HNH restriction endonuclease
MSASVAAPSRAAAYLAFCADVIRERGGVCQACKRTAAEARQKALHVHHLLPVARSGVDDGLVTCKANTMVLCNWCHALQHPGRRSWPWLAIGASRGRLLA